MEKIKDEKNVNKETEEIVETAPKSAKKEGVDLSALMAEFDKMKKVIEDQASLIEKQSQTINSLAETKAADGKASGINDETVELLKSLIAQNKDTRRDMINVIYLDDRAQLMFKLSNGLIVKFNKYGQVAPYSYEDVVRLINEHTSTFERGALKLDEDHQYMLKEKGIDVDKINYHPLETIKGFENLTYKEAQAVYDGLQLFQRDMLKGYILDVFKQNKVTDDFIDVIRRLNRYSMKDSFNGKVGFFQYFLDRIDSAEEEYDKKSKQIN